MNYEGVPGTTVCSKVGKLRWSGQISGKMQSIKTDSEIENWNRPWQVKRFN